MGYLNRYRQWLEFPALDEEIKKELLQISGSEEEIASCFSGELKFGTGGIRGQMGPGTSRLNIYSVRRVTEGLARFINKNASENGPVPSVVIAYDTRRNSEHFARETASVLIRWKIRVYLFAEPAPTPLLSFAVRELKATAGVVITASHNPAGDNGYKVYWSDGGQITDRLAQSITAEIDAVENELLVERGDLEDASRRGTLVMIGEEVIAKYREYLKGLYLSANRGEYYPQLKVVYTPLYGTGAKIIPQVLRDAGVENLFIVPRQAEPDPSFSTIRYPNPEEWGVFELAIRLGEEREADLLLATDLDADRMGVAAKDEKNHFIPLTGNQLGGLLLEYILSRRKEQQRLPANGMIIKTVVTSEIGRAIASAYGITTLETLTGFKYIGEKIKERADTGQHTFLFGYEESYGYLIGDFVRDKDAVQASLITVEMAAYYKAGGMSLIQALNRLFERYGYYAEELVNVELAERDMGEVDKIMAFFRGAGWREIGGERVIRLVDYLAGECYDLPEGSKAATGLPASNSLKYFLGNKSWFCIRPSGTEPKIKIYLGVKESSREKAETAMAALKKTVMGLVNRNK
ncbi:MAG: phospho-sugar mutase [Dethiobacter sp.]|nr:MAG: phospho-sugar mutase [Dethiobacter sp.]